jgi:hypothetical protein
MSGRSRRCSRPWTPAPITVATREPGRLKMRADSIADAAVRIPVITQCHHVLRALADFKGGLGAGCPMGLIDVFLSSARPQLRGRGPFELELLDPVANLIAVQAEQSRRFGLIPSAALERLHDERPFELLDVDAGRG